MALTYSMLSVDGGGIRGIIPARILQEIEMRSGKPISQLFHYAAGTSTGGIIVLGSSVYEKGIPKFTAKEMVDLYFDYGKCIFQKDSLGLLFAKYDRKNLDKVLEEYFGDMMLSEAAYPVSVVTYSLDKSSPKIWSSLEARLDEKNDALIKNVAGATSAAPTYFSPKIFKDAAGNLHHEVDGGIFLNNPQVLGLLQLLKYDNSITANDILMLSIGTGSTEKADSSNKLSNSGLFGWLKGGKLIDVIMDASTNFQDLVGEIIYPNQYRIQIDLPKHLGEMDNALTSNMNALLKAAEDYIEENSELIDRIVNDIMYTYGDYDQYANQNVLIPYIDYSEHQYAI